mgnify:CR=1 FL=1|jgi:uncharacterized membrane protein YedE/YeeE
MHFMHIEMTIYSFKCLLICVTIFEIANTQLKPFLGISMEYFTPVSSLLGGVLIGCAASLLLIFNGRIAGVSGIFSGLFLKRTDDWQWRVAFLVGLGIGGLVYRSVMSGDMSVPMDTSMSQLLVSGVLVGIGVTLANGCTSGHGILGIARLSVRSIVATVVFMVSAIITVAIA